MARDGTPTRNKILAETEALVLQNGFAGTSIDMILESTGITKGAFFYHFKTKNILAQALIDEFARKDLEHMDWALKETESLVHEPLERLLKFIQLFIDLMTGLKTPAPGCLYASYTNEANLFDSEVKEHISRTLLIWKSTMEKLINNVLENHSMAIKEDVDSLASLFTVIFEGSYVVSKAIDEPELIAKQLTHLKNYFQLLFIAKV